MVQVAGIQPISQLVSFGSALTLGDRIKIFWLMATKLHYPPVYGAFVGLWVGVAVVSLVVVIALVLLARHFAGGSGHGSHHHGPDDHMGHGSHHHGPHDHMGHGSHDHAITPRR